MISFEQAKTIFKRVKQQLPLGADNDRSNPYRSTVYDRIGFARDLTEKLETELMKVYTNTPLDINFKPITDFFAPISVSGISIYADLYGALRAKMIKGGNCTEQTLLSIIEFLNENLNGCVELVIVTSDLSDKNHDFLVLNRNVQSNIDDPSSWGKGTILFDPWANILYEPTDSDKMTKSNFARVAGILGNEGDLHIQILASYDKAFTLDQCDHIIGFLEAHRMFFSTTAGKLLFTSLADQSHLKDVNNEFEAFQAILEKEIERYQKLEKLLSVSADQNQTIKSSVSLSPHSVTFKLPGFVNSNDETKTSNKLKICNI